MRTIGIMAALPQEMKDLRPAVRDPISETRGHDNFLLGSLGQFPIVVALSGMGKVNAASMAQRLISEFRVAAILFSGVGGGIRSDLKIGDIVVATELYQHDFGYLGAKFVCHAPSCLPELGVGSARTSIRLCPSWPKLKEQSLVDVVVELFSGLSSELISLGEGDTSANPQISRGVIASGDQFIANESKKVELAEQGADVVEMEGAAVAQVAIKNRIPVLVLRSISDTAGAHARVDFSRFVRAASANNAALLTALLTNETLSTYFAQICESGDT